MGDERVEGTIWVCRKCGHSADNGGRLSVGSDHCRFALEEVSIKEWRKLSRYLSLTARGRALAASGDANE